MLPTLKRPLPPMAHVRQKLSSDHVANVRQDVRQKLEGFGLRQQVQRGQRIAITAGSRGIGGLAELLAGISDAVKSCGGEPFVVPAMGSHGGAQPEGQAEILRRLGVDGTEIRATMETRELGAAENGAIAHVDRLAAEADGIIVLGRTKTHPESAGELASGLLKMCTIGLGKQIGAQEAHNHGLWESVRAVPKLQIPKSRMLCGVAVVENGFRQPCAIEVVPANYEAFLEADMRLLRLAKTHLAQIPFDNLDLLIVDELGKTISGAGMDPNVIQHKSKRIVVLSLTWPSLGNGLGIGVADFTTKRFADAYDPEVCYVNLLTATEPGGNTREGPLPMAFASDREAIEVGLYSSLAGAAPRVCRIKNTGLLDEVFASEALMPEIKRNAALENLSGFGPMEYDSAGNLF